MSYLELAEAVRTRRENIATPPESVPKVLPFPATEDDLKYDLSFVRREVESFDQRYRELYAYWLELMVTAGWREEDAEKGAFHRTIKLPRREYR